MDRVATQPVPVTIRPHKERAALPADLGKRHLLPKCDYCGSRSEATGWQGVTVQEEAGLALSERRSPPLSSNGCNLLLGPTASVGSMLNE
ncbi:hypothetical protein NDU88_012671 [Pleurodeles waltl]|uniref:Uncharacterized protein n=1 Tax=Pleurodeles waltl TaxID=8319 RepID=A0AAV7R2K9_PLEWA|nr:hypothetical protein NDU88_012671 [Pleurodeles waltl]